MSTPIKIPVDSEDLDKLIADLEKTNGLLEKINNTQIKSATDQEKALKKLKAATGSQRTEIEATAQEAIKLAKANDKVNDAMSENAIKLAALKNAQQKLNQVNKNEAKLLAAKEGSYDALSAQYSLNKIRLNQLSKEERKATKEGQDLVKVTKEIYEEMKVLQAETGKTSLNVGNYQEAIEQADRASGGFIGSIKDIGKNFKALLKNPIALFLTTIVGALGALAGAFRSSEKGARLLEKGSTLVSAVFSEIVNLSVSVAEGIETAFGSVAESKVGSFASALIDGILVTLKGVINTIGFVGEAFGNLVTGEFKKASEAAVNAGKSIGQVFTGIEVGEDSKLIKGLNNLVEKVGDTVEAFDELRIARLRNQRANRELTKSIEELTTKEQLLQTIADDNTKSIAERTKANEDAQKAIEKRGLKEIQIAKNNLSLINRDIALRRSRKEDVEALLDTQLQSFQALAQAEREYTLAIRNNEKTRAELGQDRLERDLDILLDAFDNEKTIREQQIRNEELTFEQRKGILDETNKLNDSSFNEQVKRIEDFTGISLDANELIKESDAVVLTERLQGLGLSDILVGRLLEAVRDRKSANQDLAESERELNKAIKKSEEDQLKFRISLIDKAKKAYADFQKAREEGTKRTFEQQQELAQSEFDLLETTEDEKTRFALNAEKERIEKIIALNKKFGGDLSDIQIETFKNQIKKLNQEIEGIGKDKVTDIYSLFGFDLTEEKKEGIASSIGYVKDQLTELANTRAEIANQNLQQSNTEVEQAQRALQIEIENREEGLDNQVEIRNKELNLAKKNQADALKEQEKAQKTQQRIQTLEQSTSLVSASANIWKSFSGLGPAGPFLAAGAIALMFGSFAAAKIKANKVSKKTLGKGGLEIVGGGTHASGDDTYLGFQSGGKPVYAEKGEAHIVVPTDKTRKYKGVLPGLVKSLQAGTFEKNYIAANTAHSDENIFIQSQGGGLTDVSKMENTLDAIRKNGEKSTFQNSKGQTVERYKNLERTYV